MKAKIHELPPAAEKKSYFKKTLKVTVTFILVLTGLVLFTKNPTATPQKISHNLHIPEENLKAHVEKIAAMKGRNPQQPEVLKQAEDYIRSEWIKQGYEVKEQVYKVKLENGTEAEVKNLIVSYNVKDQSEQKTLVIGAHYDVWSNLSGADDNASGVAGLLELTRLVKENKPEISQRVDFVAFTLEEPPFFGTEDMGSFVHAKSLKDEKRKVSLMISLEMIGYFSDVKNSQNYPVPFLNKIYPDQGNFIALVGEFGEWFISRKVKTYFQQMTDLPISSINTTQYMEGIDWSDHLSYWKQGFPALMITDTSFLRNKNYHQPGDTPDLLDYKKSAQVVLGVYGILINF